jgi:hypothetical protein
VTRTGVWTSQSVRIERPRQTSTNQNNHCLIDHGQFDCHRHLVVVDWSYIHHATIYLLKHIHSTPPGRFVEWRLEPEESCEMGGPQVLVPGPCVLVAVVSAADADASAPIPF